MELTKNGNGYRSPLFSGPLRDERTAEAGRKAMAEGAVYGRVSTDEQRENQNIGTQREFGRSYCDLHQLPEPTFYLDDGVSGAIPLRDRPDGRRLMEDAKAGRLKTLLLYRLDRLGRDPREILNAVDELSKLGVEVRSMTEPFDTSTPAGRLMLTMLAGFAGFERESTAEKARLGRQRSAREGAWPGGHRPFGYRVEGRRRASRLVLDERPLPGFVLSAAAAEALAGYCVALVEDDPREGFGVSPAAIGRYIYHLAIAERLSTQKIAARLNALGIPSPSALNRPGYQTRGRWNSSTVHNILTKTTYKGLHRCGPQTKIGAEITERPVAALVDEETWDQAQAALEANQTFSPRNARRPYLLRGLIKCAHCRHTYTGCCRQGQPAFYVCIGQTCGGKLAVHPHCHGKPVRADEIEALIWNDIEGFLRNPAAVLAEVAAQQGERAGEAEALRREVARWTRELDGKAKERNEVISLRRRNLIDDGELEAQRAEILREETTIKAEIARLQAKAERAAQLQASLSAAEPLLRELGENMDRPWSFERKRRAVELLVARITLETVERDGRRFVEEPDVEYKFPTSGSIASTSAIQSGCNGNLPSLTLQRRSRVRTVGREQWAEAAR